MGQPNNFLLQAIENGEIRQCSHCGAYVRDSQMKHTCIESLTFAVEESKNKTIDDYYKVTDCYNLIVEGVTGFKTGSWGHAYPTRITKEESEKKLKEGLQLLKELQMSFEERVNKND
jgi:hypothetical protein